MTKKPRPVLLFIILYATMFLFGYTENTKGVTFPLIKEEFGISYETQGLMVSILTLGYTVFCFAAGVLIGKKGVKKSLAAGFAVMIAGFAGVFFAGRFLPAAGTLFLVYAGFGFFEVSINALATQLFTSRAALLMNLLHFFYGAGSSLSPRAAGALAAFSSWRMVYLLSIPMMLAVFIPVLSTPFPGQGEGWSGKRTDAADGASGPPVETTGFFTALKTPMVWIFAAALGLGVAIEISSANWAGLYFQDVYGLDPKTTGAVFISTHYILFTVSRLLSGFVVERAGYMRSLFAAVLASLAVFILGFSLGGKGIHVLPAIGFCTAILWPTILATAMRYFGGDAPVMTGAIIVIAGALNSALQFLIGVINRVTGPAWGYRSCVLYTVFALVSLIVLARCMRRPYKGAAG